MDPLYVRFGREVRRARRARRMTQEALADAVDLGRTSIVNIEKGRQRIHLHTLLELAEALEVEPASLLPEEPAVVHQIASQVETLPTPERDWVMRVVSPAPAKRPSRVKRGSGGTKTK